MLLMELLPILARALPPQASEQIRIAAVGSGVEAKEQAHLDQLNATLSRQRELYRRNRPLIIWSLAQSSQQGPDVYLRLCQFLEAERAFDSATFALANAQQALKNRRIARLMRMPRVTQVVAVLMLALAWPESCALPLVAVMMMPLVAVVGITASLTSTVFMVIVTLLYLTLDTVVEPLIWTLNRWKVCSTPLRWTLNRCHAFKNFVCDATGWVCEGLTERNIVSMSVIGITSVAEEFAVRHGFQRALTRALTASPLTEVSRAKTARYATAVLFASAHVENYRLKFLTRPPSAAVRGMLRQVSVTFLNSLLVFSPVYENRGVWAAAGAHLVHNFVYMVTIRICQIPALKDKARSWALSEDASRSLAVLEWVIPFCLYGACALALRTRGSCG